MADAQAVDRLAARCAADGCLVGGPRRRGDGYYEVVVAMGEGTTVEVVG